MHKTTIIIADDHPIFRVGIKHLIEKSDEFTLIAEAENSDQLMELLQKKTCDIVILDMRMTSNTDGMSALKIIKETYPLIKVVMMSQYCNKNIIDEAMDLGADAYITKNDISEMLLPYLKSVMKGGKVFSPRVQSQMIHSDNDYVEKLTPREKEILRLSSTGYSRQEIAEKLNITISTVHFHRNNIKDKLNAENLAEMISIAHEKGLI